MNIPYIIIMMLCLTAHLVATLVVSVFAKKRVQYLPLAWVLGIITIGMLGCLLLFYSYEEIVDVGLIHPSIVLPLAASTFLETLYPLGLIMPGFLQWKRSIKYALPVIIVVAGYFVGVMIVGHAPVLHTIDDIRKNFWIVPDVFIRLVALGLSIYYIIGIIRMPRLMLRHNTQIPTYLKGYCTWIAITYIFFIALSVRFDWWLLYVVLFMLTFLNMGFMLQSLERIADSLPLPRRETITTPPDKIDEQEMEQDFNDANLQRFKQAEHFMQNTKAWTDVQFTRETLCEGVGFNRHLLLQSLRSQGYNNVHEYITTYRVELLQKIVQQHRADSLTHACEQVGFTTLITARTAYKKTLSRDLDTDWNS